MKMEPNKVKILSENVHVQVKSKYDVLANVLASQKSKALSRVWIGQNDVHIAENLTKGTHS